MKHKTQICLPEHTKQHPLEALIGCFNNRSSAAFSVSMGTISHCVSLKFISWNELQTVLDRRTIKTTFLSPNEQLTERRSWRKSRRTGAFGIFGRKSFLCSIVRHIFFNGLCSSKYHKGMIGDKRKTWEASNILGRFHSPVRPWSRLFSNMSTNDVQATRSILLAIKVRGPWYLPKVAELRHQSTAATSH